MESCRLPIMVVEKIMNYITDPISFRNLACTSRIFAWIARKLTIKKKKEFATFIRRPSRSRQDLEYDYYILPNGDLHGKYQMWSEGTCLISGEYRDGIRVGIWYHAQLTKNGHFGYLQKRYIPLSSILV